MLGVARLGTPQATGAAATAQERQLPLKVRLHGLFGPVCDLTQCEFLIFLNSR